MADNVLEEEVARYVDAKQNGRHLLDNSQNTYKKVRTRDENVHYACTQKKKLGCNATAVVKGDRIVKSLWPALPRYKLSAKKGERAGEHGHRRGINQQYLSMVCAGGSDSLGECP